MTFLENVRSAGLENTVVPIRADSREAHRYLADRAFDMIFIDANHHYSYVKIDLENYRHKVRPNGLLTGHDCEVRYQLLVRETRAAIDANLESDWLPEYKIHPGVVKAVSELTYRVKMFAEQTPVCWLSNLIRTVCRGERSCFGLESGTTRNCRNRSRRNPVAWHVR